MELKTARFTLLLDPAKKAAFEQLCLSQDLTPSQVVRKLMRQYLDAHGVHYVPSGSTGASAQAAAPASGGGGPAQGVSKAVGKRGAQKTAPATAPKTGRTGRPR